MIKFIDLFAGLGGFRIAMESIGAECVFSSEIDQKVANCYEANFGGRPHGDITKIDEESIPDHDVLCAGFPCQAFSVAGRREGFEDARGTLFFDIARIARAKKPKVLFLENVKGLLSHDKGNTFRTIQSILSDLGYSVFHKVLNTSDFGLPQNRERVYIICILGDVDNFSFPSATSINGKVIGNYIAQEVANKYYYTASCKFYDMLGDVEPNKAYQWRRTYLRENKSGVFPTLTANMGTGGHNVPIVRDSFGVRKITPYEAFKIQGFPRWYRFDMLSDSSAYKAIGNSVSIPVLVEITKKIKEQWTRD